MRWGTMGVASPVAGRTASVARLRVGVQASLGGFTAAAVALALLTPLAPASPVPTAVAGAAPRSVAGYRQASGYGHLPLSFIANAGQRDATVAFEVRGPNHNLLFGRSQIALIGGASASPLVSAGATSPLTDSLPAVVTVAYPGATDGVAPSGEEPLPGVANFFAGDDPADWRTSVPTFGGVRYRDLYPGVDLVYTGRTGELKSIWEVAAGSDPTRIALAYSGTTAVLWLDAGGALHVPTAAGDLVEAAPVAHQPAGDAPTPVAARFVLRDGATVGFALDGYDPDRPLVIDPVLGYSTYIGPGSPRGIAVDNTGNAYIIGTTSDGGACAATSIPTTPGAFQVYNFGAQNSFVTKLNPAGTALVYSTYLGGNRIDAAAGIAIDAQGNAYLTGTTDNSTMGFGLCTPPFTPRRFPTTPGAYLTSDTAGQYSFLTKLNPTGTALVYSTLFSGGIARGIAVDGGGNAYLTGAADETLPTTAGAFQTAFGTGGSDAFVTKFNPTGTALVYSTYLGGSGQDNGFAVAVDATGNAYLTGYSRSTTPTPFPTTAGVFQPTNRGYDAFVTKLNPAGSALVYSTLLGGGSTDEGHGIAIDAQGNAYVAGTTMSSAKFSAPPIFPITVGAFQTSPPDAGASGDAFVTKLNPAGTALVYSTYLGGNAADKGHAIALDAQGQAWVTGTTRSPDPSVNPPTPAFPTTGDAIQTTRQGTEDAFVSGLNAAGSALVYSTYLGTTGLNSGDSLAVDSVGNIYVTGFAATGFPTTAGSFQPTVPASGGAYSLRFGAGVLPTPTAQPTATATATTTPGTGGGGLGNLAFINPVRVVDTRPAPFGPIGFKPDGTASAAGQLTGGSVTRFKIAGQTFSGTAIPADATGVLINVTLVQAAPGGGFVTVYPGDAATPPNASTLNPSTAVAANFWTVGLAPAGGANAGTIAINSVADPRDVLIDLVGYYSPSNPATVGNLKFITPVRVLDTRGASVGGPIGVQANGAAVPVAPITPNQINRYQLAGQTFGGTTFPADVTGILAHVTTVQGAGSGGFTTLVPGNATGTPTTSTVNPSNAIAFNSWANGIPTTGGAGSAGTFGVYSTNVQDVVVDVVGYYAPSNPNTVGSLALVTPARVVDTRAAPFGPIGFKPDGSAVAVGQLAAGSTTRYLLNGRTFSGLTLPADVKGALINVTIVQGSAGGGFLTVYPGDAPAAPNTSTVNPSTAIAASFWASGVPNAPASNPGTLAATSVGDPRDLIVDLVGYFR